MKDLLKTAGGIVLAIAAVLAVLTLFRYVDRQPSVVLTNVCTPPCWYRIKPGEMNFTQVFETINAMEIVNADTISIEEDAETRPSEIFWAFQRPAEDSTGSVFFENDTAIAINILTVRSLTLGDLFERFGEPETYWAEFGSGENREYVEVALFYPAKGFVADVVIDIEYGTNYVEIESSTPVFRVSYFDPQMLDTLLETRILIDRPVNARKGSFQTWLGFGVISFER